MMSGIKMTFDGNTKYFTRERLIAVAKKNGNFNQKKYNSKQTDNSFLIGNFFMDHFDPEWMDLYGQTEEIKVNMELTGKTK